MLAVLIAQVPAVSAAVSRWPRQYDEEPLLDRETLQLLHTYLELKVEMNSYVT